MMAVFKPLHDRAKQLVHVVGPSRGDGGARKVPVPASQVGTGREPMQAGTDAMAVGK